MDNSTTILEGAPKAVASKPRIATLTGLRAVAAFAIFLFHSGLLKNGAFPVVLFFMLSGFVIYYSKSNSIESMSYGKWLSWAGRKIAAFWAIHMVTFAASIFIRDSITTKSGVRDVIVAAILNVTLTQAWSESYALSFNGLSWYLSVTVFLYVVGYFILRFIVKINRKQVIAVVAAVFLIQCACNAVNVFSDNEIPIYTNPLYRLTDFILGVCAAKLFCERSRTQIKRANLVETLIAVALVMLYGATYIWKAQCNWFCALFFVTIYVFAFGNGWISKMLTHRLFLAFAAISFEFYMVHELVLIAVNKLLGDLDVYWLVHNIIVAAPSLIISLLLAYLCKRFISKPVKKLLRG